MYSDTMCIDVPVGFQMDEYTVNETSSVEICIEHKNCLQRAVNLDVCLSTVGAGVWAHFIVMHT